MELRSSGGQRTAFAESTLRQELARAGLVDFKSSWHSYSGGRTNAIWRIDDGTTTIVCKLYSDASGSPLFPNDAGAEALALRALAGTGIAPELVAEHLTSLGPCLLYRHIEGTPFSGDPALVARALSRLHTQPPPIGIRQIKSDPDALYRQGDRILDACTGPIAKNLRDRRPEIKHQSRCEPVFLHGDAVPANMISGPNGLTLIDWQCPALGCPVEDLAIFLSPAMQSLYGGRVLDEVSQECFLAAYGNPNATQSYLALKPLLHWRMAAHCLWKSDRGFEDYSAAMELELEQLKQL